MFDSSGVLSLKSASGNQKKDLIGYHKVLIVDDEQSVHDVTALAIDGIVFLDKGIELLHAYSAAEAKDILQHNQDIAVMFLDVVMETSSAGLDLVKVIREELQNTKVRIILRTGQAGSIPEEDVIVNYDINSYKNKSELTTQKLFTTLIASLRSYTYLEELEQQKEAEKNLMESRIKQMSDMISMIAHQWRQPLSSISTIAINLKMKQDLDLYDFSKEDDAKKFAVEVNEAVSKIENYTKTLSTTIDDFRNFYKKNKAPSIVRLDDIVRSSLYIIGQTLTDNHIEVIQENNVTDTVECFENEIKQVIINLLKNAQDQLLEKRIENPFVKIQIKNTSVVLFDNGGGIPEDVIKKVFDPYFSTKNEKNGTGLGLYMCKVIIEKHHGGSLSVSNTKDGACFTIELGKVKNDL